MAKTQQPETQTGARLTAVVPPELARKVKIEALDSGVRVGKLIETILTAHYSKKGGAR